MITAISDHISLLEEILCLGEAVSRPDWPLIELVSRSEVGSRGLSPARMKEVGSIR